MNFWFLLLRNHSKYKSLNFKQKNLKSKIWKNLLTYSPNSSSHYSNGPPMSRKPSQNTNLNHPINPATPTTLLIPAIKKKLNPQPIITTPKQFQQLGTFKCKQYQQKHEETTLVFQKGSYKWSDPTFWNKSIDSNQTTKYSYSNCSSKWT